MKPGLPLCVLLLCGCSSLKTAGMRDARVLKQGKWEFFQETSTTASIPDAVLRKAARENPDAGRILDAFPDSVLYLRGGGFMSGFGIARGMAGGWEWNAAMGGFIGSSILEAGLKKKVYDRGPFMLSGYGRLAAGSAMNIRSLPHPGPGTLGGHLPPEVRHKAQRASPGTGKPARQNPREYGGGSHVQFR